jgi:hypothetical protein
MSHSKGIITIAIGKKYAKQAKYLALSCKLNASDTRRAVITDKPELLNDFYDIIIHWDNNDDPFSVKTRIFELSPFDNTLYLDADSLVYNPIDEYWNYLENNNYVYEGAKLTQGEWYFNIEKICKTLNVPWIPKFNSGMLLFNKDERAKQIFDTAYYYFINHKKEGIDIPFFRGKNYPDEPAFAIALAKSNMEPVNDNGCFSRTLIGAKKIKLNISKHIAQIYKNGQTMRPLVVHFCGRKNALYYLREKFRLFLHFHF